MNSLTEPAEPEPDAIAARPPLVRELLLVVGLFLVYKFGRQLANGHTAEAFHNADNVWSFERAAHLPGEGSVQSLLLHSDALVHGANIYYASVHFPATLALLVFLYLRRPRHYLWTRRVLAVLTAAALALHLAYPLAPPRMLKAAHLVDTAQVYGPSVYAAKPDTDTMANQFAAMPSLHFGWALMVAIGLIAATRSRWRWLWLLHPLLTLLVIVGTANHYWLDTIVATALLGVALAVIRLPRTVSGRGIGRHLLPAPARPAAVAETRAAAVTAPWSPRPAFRTPPDALSASDVLARMPIRIPVQVSPTPGSTSVATAPQLVTSGAHR
ncbi:phosphatase PAP2 family protein [Streptomyces sp. VRA16 Mangrove soil]|uniref:phosphatase PAP2 family protein n=1 Tax=Streptomyces sp. VRA16 Mangrove soil TaxID=2817434 RepID=UPI001A9F9C11|nr:phosphatase PAP2 family protein [Streptomyces sp. VRA16 Mangrove soil]MBO1330843.1 phosphatase PAP2 family protein [Streptomyces sp. VRA16 Mangrove soil]